MLSLSKHVRWVGLLMLAGCAEPGPEAPKGDMIACALDGAAEFAQDCSVERNAAQITIRRPDGGFRRFEIAADGGVNSLDGADPATSTALADSVVELRIGDDRFRLKPEEPAHAGRR